MRKIFGVAILLATIFGTAALARPKGQTVDPLKIIFLDVGQGDSILFILPNGNTLLIDGGPDTQTDWLLQNYISPYFCRVNMVLLTHPDADHSSGLVRVAEHCYIDIIFQDFVPSDTFIYKKWLEISSKFKSVELYAGSHFSVSNVNFYVVWPPENLEAKDTNSHSLSLFVDFGTFEALFTGDLESEMQPELQKNLESLSGLIDRPFELFKAPHHGAANGLNRDLVSWLKPEVFVVSVGAKNTYGHPNQEVLDFLEELGAKVFRNDKDGTVEISVR